MTTTRSGWAVLIIDKTSSRCQRTGRDIPHHVPAFKPRLYDLKSKQTIASSEQAGEKHGERQKNNKRELFTVIFYATALAKAAGT